MPTFDDDRDTIFAHGHRRFVGGNDEYHWTRIGELQCAFLRGQGLLPGHVLFDIACGSLRAGIHFIDYLNPARYVGFDKYIELIILGVGRELGMDRYSEKRPRFHIGDRFDFAAPGLVPDFAIAQSLFTHLTAADIRACLRGLAAVAGPQTRFFATFLEAPAPTRANPARSHAHGVFLYTRAEMEEFGRECGFTPHYIGEWNHPRAQRIIEYRPIA